MKLIDLLVKELPKRGGWPTNISYIAQDEGSATWGFCYKPEMDSDDEWMDSSDAGYEMQIGYIGDADDCKTSVISKPEYESSLAASEGWIEWCGGECPVDGNTMIDIQYRDGTYTEGEEARYSCWIYTNESDDIIAYRLHKPEINSRANDDRLEKDLNECIGQDVDMPEWNGDGLPPVGTICEALMPALDNTLWRWRTVKVVESGAPGAEKEVLAYDIENTKPAWTDEFRPRRTEAQKAMESAKHIIADLCRDSASNGHSADLIMEAIAAGKVPGVKLESK